MSPKSRSAKRRSLAFGPNSVAVGNEIVSLHTAMDVEEAFDYITSHNWSEG